MSGNVLTDANGVVYVDIDEGLKRVINNRKLYAKLLYKFKTDNVNLMNDILTFAQNGDYEKARIAAHTLKGIAANLSLIELYKQIVVMETQIKEKTLNQDVRESAQNCFEKTLTLVDKVIEQYG